MTDGWIARDKDGDLTIYSNKPTRGIVFWFAKPANVALWRLPSRHPTGEGLTWGDPPVPVVFQRVEMEEGK